MKKLLGSLLIFGAVLLALFANPAKAAITSGNQTFNSFCNNLTAFNASYSSGVATLDIGLKSQPSADASFDTSRLNSTVQSVKITNPATNASQLFTLGTVFPITSVLGGKVTQVQVPTGNLSQGLAQDTKFDIEVTNKVTYMDIDQDGKPKMVSLECKSATKQVMQVQRQQNAPNNPNPQQPPQVAPIAQQPFSVKYCDPPNNTKIDTAIGCIPIREREDFAGWVLGWFIGISGGIAFLLLLWSGFQIMTASGNPDQVRAGKEQLTAAISGLILIIFSIFLLRLIGVNILSLPGIKP